jgi:hypothetical protein
VVFGEPHCRFAYISVFVVVFVLTKVSDENIRNFVRITAFWKPWLLFKNCWMGRRIQTEKENLRLGLKCVAHSNIEYVT